MKPLPTLSVDCRNKTIENNHVAGTQVIINARTGDRVGYILADPDGHYRGAGEIVDRCNAYEELVKRLRYFAIVDTQKPGVARVEYDGKRCLSCGSRWKLFQPETHASECILKGTKP